MNKDNIEKNINFNDKNNESEENEMSLEKYFL